MWRDLGSKRLTNRFAPSKMITFTLTANVIFKKPNKQKPLKDTVHFKRLNIFVIWYLSLPLKSEHNRYAAIKWHDTTVEGRRSISYN